MRHRSHRGPWRRAPHAAEWRCRLANGGGRVIITEIDSRDRLERHEACVAWRQIDPGFVPVAVVNLTRRGYKKSSVYRLDRKDSISIVAKRATRAAVARERFIYQDVLPDLQLSSLRCFGTLDDSD